eukprot:Opistho-2@68143
MAVIGQIKECCSTGILEQDAADAVVAEAARTGEGLTMATPGTGCGAMAATQMGTTAPGPAELADASTVRRNEPSHNTLRTRPAKDPTSTTAAPAVTLPPTPAAAQLAAAAPWPMHHPQPTQQQTRSNAKDILRARMPDVFGEIDRRTNKAATRKRMRNCADAISDDEAYFRDVGVKGRGKEFDRMRDRSDNSDAVQTVAAAVILLLFQG